MIEVDYNEYKETIAENIKLIQTNHKLKEKYYLMRTNANQLAKRIDKAVECIEYWATDNEDYSKLYSAEEEELLEILKGEDKE